MMSTGYAQRTNGTTILLVFYVETTETLEQDDFENKNGLWKDPPEFFYTWNIYMLDHFIWYIHEQKIEYCKIIYKFRIFILKAYHWGNIRRLSQYFLNVVF